MLNRLQYCHPDSSKMRERERCVLPHAVTGSACMLGALFGTPLVTLRPNVTLITIVCAALAFVNSPAAFQLDPVQPSSLSASLPRDFYNTPLFLCRF
jgi:hypothetical protein